MLYEVENKDQYDFAQSWVEALLKANLASTEHKWHTHSSEGFISTGTRFSFIVLHNAVDPFEWGAASESTTTIGVYGAHWYEHEEIHWKTVTPHINYLLQWSVEIGAISIKKKWRCDEPKASEKRFHRAYWLAANLRDLKGLLNHGTTNDVAHDAVDTDWDEEFEVAEQDLTAGWSEDALGDEEGREAWDKILAENEQNGDTDGFQHVRTGCSEWM
tara:strand:+ start:6175 stop:6822 length:648 start_codon:yes stop_codon:yes gene_type:complete